jgi:nicotinamide-nucleotide amidase
MTLEEDVGRLLIENGLTVAVAESCTGGLICHRITNVPGSSGYFLCGIVSYCNESKISILGVDQKLIETHGAVSKECAQSMAEGVKKIADTEIGIASTGIAGPSGGSKEKPIGLVFIALSVKDHTEVMRYCFHGSREDIKLKSSEAALNMLRSYLVAGFNVEGEIE